MPRISDHADDAVHSAANGARASQRAIQRNLDRLADTAAEMRDQAGPTVDRIRSRAADAARHGMDWMRDSGYRVRTSVGRASDRTVGYVREEPLRSVLMAAAAGALLFAVVRIVAGRSDHHR